MLALDHTAPDPAPTPGERFTRLDTLRKFAWESIEARRGMEWKASIALWTLQAAFAYGLIQAKLALADGEKIAISFFPIGVLVAHTWWMHGLFKAYNIDKLEELRLREQMGELACHTPDIRVVRQVEQYVRDRWESPNAFANSLHGPQVLTTAILSVLLLLVIFKDPEPVRPSTPKAGAACCTCEDQK